MDAIDRQIVTLLLDDARLTYQELGRAVRLSANTTADRVRRLRSSGVLKGYHAALDYEAIGRPLRLISDVRLRENTDNAEFQDGLAAIPQITEAYRVTGEYDYQLHMSCISTPEFQGIVDTLKRDHSVREVRSRLVLHAIPLAAARILDA